MLEKPRVDERARVYEKPKNHERANKEKKPKGKERARDREKSKKGEEMRKVVRLVEANKGHIWFTSMCFLVVACIVAIIMNT